MRDVPVHVPVYDWIFLGIGGLRHAKLTGGVPGLDVGMNGPGVRPDRVSLVDGIERGARQPGAPLSAERAWAARRW